MRFFKNKKCSSLRIHYKHYQFMVLKTDLSDNTNIYLVYIQIISYKTSYTSLIQGVLKYLIPFWTKIKLSLYGILKLYVLNSAHLITYFDIFHHMCYVYNSFVFFNTLIPISKNNEQDVLLIKHEKESLLKFVFTFLKISGVTFHIYVMKKLKFSCKIGCICPSCLPNR